MRDNSAPRRLLPVATLLVPDERPDVDAAGEGYYSTLHRDTVDDLITDLRSREIHAVLVSVTYAMREPARITHLVREFPRIPAVALLTELHARTPHAVLALGRSGINRLVDVRMPAGGRELRGALMADSGQSAQREALGQLAVDLAGTRDDLWRCLLGSFPLSPPAVTLSPRAR